MKQLTIILSLLTSGLMACSTTHTQTAASKIQTPVAPKVDVANVDEAIARLTSELNALQALDEKVYAKSLKGDDQIRKELQVKTDQLGSVDTIQANLKVLKELKSQNQ